jgi:hypothetical protein
VCCADDRPLPARTPPDLRIPRFTGAHAQPTLVARAARQRPRVPSTAICHFRSAFLHRSWTYSRISSGHRASGPSMRNRRRSLPAYTRASAQAPMRSLEAAGRSAPRNRPQCDFGART